MFHDQIIINNGEQLVTGEHVLGIQNRNAYRISSDFISLIFDGRIAIYDASFALLREVNDSSIDVARTTIECFGKDDFAIITSRELRVYNQGVLIAHKENFWGKILSSKYRLNFNEMSLKNLNYFRCSNLADNRTYFEFWSKPGEQILRNFYCVNDELFFLTTNDTHCFLIVIEISTGKVLAELALSYPFFQHDRRRNLLVAMWTGGNDGRANYQVVDVSARQVDIGETSGKVVRAGINTPKHLQYLYGDNFYFVDNHSAASTLDPICFGRMKLNTKTIEQVWQITEAPASPIAEVIEHKQKIYVRNSNADLFIYEDR